MGEEEGFYDGIFWMEGGEGVKNKRSGIECVGIVWRMEDVVDMYEIVGRVSYGIVGGGKIVNDFVFCLVY